MGNNKRGEKRTWDRRKFSDTQANVRKTRHQCFHEVPFVTRQHTCSLKRRVKKGKKKEEREKKSNQEETEKERYLWEGGEVFEPNRVPMRGDERIEKIGFRKFEEELPLVFNVFPVVV